MTSPTDIAMPSWPLTEPLLAKLVEKDAGPCGHELLVPQAYLREFVCTRGCTLRSTR